MPREITFSLDAKSIDAAIREVREYKQRIVDKTKLLTEKLALLGAQEAAHRFGSAMYDGNNDVVVEATATEHGWVITASGEAVAFIEFGSGVTYNPTELYPNPRPPGIVGIGEYGKGYGKRKGWMFYDDNGQKVFTRGNPPSLAMYFASEEMRNELSRIAQEVFGND